MIYKKYVEKGKLSAASLVNTLWLRLTLPFKSGIVVGLRCELINMRIARKPLRCGVEQWQLVGLITRRSQVQVLPPLPKEHGVYAVLFFLARTSEYPLASANDAKSQSV